MVIALEPTARVAAPASSRDALADAFEQHRGRLLRLAYRMLGSRADAEDAVQEAWLRLARVDSGTIDNLAGWLTSVVSRLCLDMIRARKVRLESLFAETLPESVAPDGDVEPEDDVLLAESIGAALAVVLDSLDPAERLAFVLHDMFSVPFRGIAELIGRSTAATKMLASRARRKVHGTPPPGTAGPGQREAVIAFLAAARAGEFMGLLRVLDPDVTLYGHLDAA